MKLIKLIRLMILAWLAFSAGAALCQERKTVKGLMLDESTLEPVPLANILIQPSGEHFISNRKGFFRITVGPSDSAYITAIGYRPKGISANGLNGADDTVSIYLQPIVYKLKDVNVVYTNRKRDSIARLAAEFLKNDPLLNNYDRVLERQRGSMMSPLTAMYEEWSKEGQDMRKFEEFLRYAEQQKIIDRRFNKKMIRKLTGIDEARLDDFIMFCRPDRDFLTNAPDYDVYEAIKKCGDDFKAKQRNEKQKLR
jgi:hypothetical protein